MYRQPKAMGLGTTLSGQPKKQSKYSEDGKRLVAVEGRFVSHHKN
jgi:hypothetical protein